MRSRPLAIVCQISDTSGNSAMMKNPVTT